MLVVACLREISCDLLDPSVSLRIGELVLDIEATKKCHCLIAPLARVQPA
jgi:hypothetical protein